MRREGFWWTLWTALLVIHGFYGLTSGPAVSSAEATGGPASPQREELHELIEQTRKTWERLRVDESGHGADLPEHPLLRRAEWLLRLREAEQRLRSTGVDMEVCAVLEKWFEQGGAGGRERLEGDNQYLGGLVRWCNGWPTGEGAGPLRRIRVHPGKAGGYPEVEVELQGGPAKAGARLLAAGLPGKDWRWRGLELRRPPEDRNWWLRGIIIHAHES